MTTRLFNIGTAVLLALSVVACTDQTKDPLQPTAPSKTLAVLSPGPIAKYCTPGTIFCPNPFIDVSAGGSVTCALRTSGVAVCWGDNTNGMLGRGVGAAMSTCVGLLGQFPCSPTPALVAGGNNFKAISVGTDHVCALQIVTGQAFCWGNNSVGQLGIAGGSTQAPSTAVSTIAFNSISAGSSESCGIDGNGSLFCWGGKFGMTPVQQGGTFSSVSESPNGYCALRTDGFVMNSSGSACVWASAAQSLGQATTASHFCEISNGVTGCWGSNTFGELGGGAGLGASSSSLVSVRAPIGVTFSSVATGARHSCALAGNTAFCWGDNWYGELGIYSNASTSSIPQQVSGSTAFAKITTGVDHTCGLDTGGSVWCWGANEAGQVGNGSITPLPSPDSQQPLFNGVAFPVKVATP